MQSLKARLPVLVFLLSLGILIRTAIAQVCPATPFDPTDSKYQVNPKYPPDKLSTWTYGIELDGWMLAHDALRGEVGDFADTLSHLIRLSSSLEPRQRSALHEWWILHLRHMQSHHRNEDRIVKRFASPRFIYPDFMHHDHAQIEQHLNSIDNLIKKLIDTNTNSSTSTTLISQLDLAWVTYTADLECHLRIEEQVCIPLIRAYFTMPQVHRMAHRLARIGPQVETGAIIHYTGHERIEQVMKAQQIPTVVRKIAWVLVLEPRYRYYQTNMKKLVDILRQAT